MRDYLEKYMVIQEQFPNKAGKLLHLVTNQKNLTQKLARQKNSEDVNRLLLATAEGYDVTVELLEWTKNVLQGVLNDVEYTQEGAKYRNIIAMQSALISELKGIKQDDKKQ